MAVNKYGNDWKNNIMWNKEYPFIPEVTNDAGFTIHEGDVVDFLYDERKQIYKAARVYKIYSKDYIWVRFFYFRNKTSEYMTTSNEFFPHDPANIPPKDESFEMENQGGVNYLHLFLASVYSEDKSLRLPNDWHADPKKVTARRLREVEALKKKY